MSQAPVLYLGDTSLRTAAAYLGGVMAHAGIAFDYLASDLPATPQRLAAPRQLVILSDYPARNMPAEVQRLLVTQVEQGAGLLMIGGWESYGGLGGDWGPTAVGQILPVQIAERDDRVNCDQPTLVVCRREHPITAGLPWGERPPVIGGFNRVTPKAGGPEATEVLLQAQRWTAQHQGEGFTFHPADTDALLVVAPYGRGRTACLMTDVAPHWVGGWVDWGDQRVQAQAPGAEAIEVGNLYAQFFQQLLRWTGHL